MPDEQKVADKSQPHAETNDNSLPETASINIEVAYATPQAQLILPVRIPAAFTIEEAIKASGILEDFPEIDLSENKVGIFGKLGKLNNILQDKDRIEIYRKLIADPKAVRKQRAAEGKQMKKGGGTV